MGKVYIAMFALVVVTAIAFFTVVFWIGATAISFLVAGRPIGSSFLLAIPPAVGVLSLLLPILVLVEISAFLLLSMARWRGTPHRLRWDIIPNHNVVVAMTAYNDEESIADAVNDFGNQPDVKQVIVVDNNSQDRTALLAQSAGARVVREENQGYGFACMRGLREALLFPNVNVVALVEGDMTFSGRDLSKLIPYLDNVDMIVGTRTTQELNAGDSQLGWFYVWGNMFLAKLVQIKFFDIKHLGRVRLTDVGCTMRAIRPDALRSILERLDVGGNHFSPHMLMVAIASGLKVLEVPVTFHKRWGKSKGAGGSKWRGLGIGFRMIWHILSF